MVGGALIKLKAQNRDKGFVPRGSQWGKPAKPEAQRIVKPVWNLRLEAGGWNWKVEIGNQKEGICKPAKPEVKRIVKPVWNLRLEFGGWKLETEKKVKPVLEISS